MFIVGLIIADIGGTMYRKQTQRKIRESFILTAVRVEMKRPDLARKGPFNLCKGDRCWQLSKRCFRIS
jgi:hypothetical protein